MKPTQIVFNWVYSNIPFVVDGSGLWELAHMVRFAFSAAASQQNSLYSSLAAVPARLYGSRFCVSLQANTAGRPTIFYSQPL
ncbi:MAG: hypothetical protein WBH50_12860 [Fuerstiella sp.]